MSAEVICKIIATVASVFFTILVPSVIALIKYVKAYKKAKEAAQEAKNEEERQRAEAEKQAAINDLKELAQNFIVEAENLYQDIDTIVKKEGKTCGPVKKDSVMTKIQGACIVKGEIFNKEYWSNYIDNFVAATREVNAKK